MLTPSRLYPEIISDEQRRQYKTEFDSDLTRYKTLCAEMDEISDHVHKLSRELDELDKDSIKYKVEKEIKNKNRVANCQGTYSVTAF